MGKKLGDEDVAGRVEELRRSLGALSEKPRRSSGIAALDRLLPRGGYPSGSIVEWLGEEPGSEAANLALWAARGPCLEGQAVVVIDDQRRFYPWGLVRRWGLADPAPIRDRLIVLRPRSPEDSLWALDQALRCPGVGAVMGWLGPCSDRTARRLHQAAEEGGGLGLLLRPHEVAASACWGECRWRVGAQPSAGPVEGLPRVRVELLRARGGCPDQVVELVIDEQAGDVRLAPELADPASRARSSAGLSASRGA